VNDPNETIIRAATPADAEALAVMLDAMNVEDGQPPGRYDEATVRRDGFGEEPAFSILLACIAGRAVGYTLFVPFYNTELARRGLWMVDLWIAPNHRRRGLGRRLVAALAERTVAEGRASIWWTVRNGNVPALAFYAALGVKDDDTRLLELDGVALQALAAAGR
jgi:ribosomal protein S18 acetylase RimI-like enzyme